MHEQVSNGKREIDHVTCASGSSKSERNRLGPSSASLRHAPRDRARGGPQPAETLGVENTSAWRRLSQHLGQNRTTRGSSKPGSDRTFNGRVIGTTSQPSGTAPKRPLKTTRGQLLPIGKPREPLFLVARGAGRSSSSRLSSGSNSEDISAGSSTASGSMGAGVPDRMWVGDDAVGEDVGGVLLTTLGSNSATRESSNSATRDSARSSARSSRSNSGRASARGLRPGKVFAPGAHGSEPSDCDLSASSSGSRGSGSRGSGSSNSNASSRKGQVGPAATTMQIQVPSESAAPAPRPAAAPGPQQPQPDGINKVFALSPVLESPGVAKPLAHPEVHGNTPEDSGTLDDDSLAVGNNRSELEWAIMYNRQINGAAESEPLVIEPIPTGNKSYSSARQPTVRTKIFDLETLPPPAEMQKRERLATAPASVPRMCGGFARLGETSMQRDIIRVKHTHVH